MKQYCQDSFLNTARNPLASVQGSVEHAELVCTYTDGYFVQYVIINQSTFPDHRADCFQTHY